MAEHIAGGGSTTRIDQRGDAGVEDPWRLPSTLFAQHADLVAHWMAILPSLVEALPLLGIEERDIMLTGHRSS